MPFGKRWNSSKWISELEVLTWCNCFLVHKALQKKKSFSIWCCHLLWDGNIFIMANNEVSLSKGCVFLLKCRCAFSTFPRLLKGLLSGQKTEAYLKHGQPLSQTLASQVPLIYVGLGCNTSGEGYGGRGETAVPTLVHIGTQQAPSTEMQGDNPALLGFTEPWLDLSSA